MLSAAVFITTLHLLTILDLSESKKFFTVKSQKVAFKGKVVEENDNQYGVFLKIPYAKPPLNTLRFRKPIPFDYANRNNFVDASRNFSKKCIQFGERPRKLVDTKEESEDCLYLNVMTPKFENTDDLYPVMVWIHGGAFVTGSASEFPVDGILRNLVQRGVVVVTINYRLGPFGFWNTKSSVAPGNYGLWDQVEALRWVQKYIKDFGGDPGKVTIFGSSAGGSSVSYLTLSPATRGLFHQAVMMSGSSLAPWAITYDDNHNDASGWLSEDLNCRNEIERKPAQFCYSKNFEPSENPQLLKYHKSELECLRKKAANRIFKLAERVFPAKDCSIHLNVWAPRVDGDLLPEDLEILISKRSPMNLMIGVTRLDGANFALRDNITSREEFESFSIPACITCQITSYPELVRPVVKYKYADTAVVLDSDQMDYWMYQDINLKTNLMFLTPAYKETMAALKTKSNVFLYSWEYPGADAWYEDEEIILEGAFHGSEVGYLFDMIEEEEPDRITAYNAIKDTLGTLWTNFAKHGKPTLPDGGKVGLKWIPTTSHTLEYLSIDGLISTMMDKFYEEDITFWGKLIPELENATKHLTKIN